MTSTLPGILTRGGDDAIKQLIEASLGVDLNLTQVAIEPIDTVDYTEQRVAFRVRALAIATDGLPGRYSGETSVVLDRFEADNYFSNYAYHIHLDAPYTLVRIREALLAQTGIRWEAGDFIEVDSTEVPLDAFGEAHLDWDPQSKRLWLIDEGKPMTVVITPVGRISLARMLPPARLMPPSQYYNNSNTKVNIGMRLPDANGVIVADELINLAVGHRWGTETDLTPVNFMTVIYGRADGWDVSWYCQNRPLDNNLFGAVVRYNGPATAEFPPSHNPRLDRVCVIELSALCANYTGNAIIYYNRSRIA